MTVADNAIQATMAYRGAIEDYGNFVDQQMRSFGWQMPGQDGQYSVLNAQNAFDPDSVVQFDESGNPTFDQASILQQTSGGQYGSTGRFAEATQQGGTQEADINRSIMNRGLGRGSGLGQQAQALSEGATGGNLASLSSELFGGLQGKYGDLAKKYQNVGGAKVSDAQSNAQRLAQLMSLYNA
jgi:hypothetical protein